MAFNIKKRDAFNYSSPNEMYQDNKMKKIRGLLDYQGSMLDEYMKNISKKNVALELPTGSGKTLVGLLIGDYRRRKHKEQVVYLCPTKQLVNQVVDQAVKKYGIKVTGFIGSQKDYAPKDKTQFQLSETIGITTYSAFFTQESMFENVDVIIMDDVHSSEEYIISNWTVKINGDDQIFDSIASILKHVISESSYDRLTTNESNAGDIVGWCDLVPMTLLDTYISNIEEHLNLGLIKGTSNYYSWNRIGQNLSECNFYISNKSILIRPWIAPTVTYEPYAKAKQKVLMSATLGKSGELERITGLSNIYRLPIVNEWDKRGLGRKFFVMPDLSLGDNQQGEVFKKLHKATNKKSVVLTPDDRVANSIKGFVTENLPKAKVFLAKEIEDTKDAFIDEEDAIVILANRFDGVDFADNDSRMLFIIDLPKTTNLQERFLINKIGSAILYDERIRTRIVQAVGRCSRNPGDYSVVCILGDSIQNDLTKPEKQRMFPPELRAELQFGIDQSKQYNNVLDILEQINDFLERNENWEEAEDEIVNLRNEYCKESYEKEMIIFNKLHEASKYEVKFQYAIWKRDYLTAFETAESIVSVLDAPSLGGYKCFWQYMSGSLAYRLLTIGKNEFKSKCLESFKSAIKADVKIQWLPNLVNQVTSDEVQYEEDNYAKDIIDRIEEKFVRMNTSKKFESKVNQILENLNSEDGLKFEKGHLELGELLGYISLNSNATAAPDPYWIINSKLCIVAEDKIYESEEHLIPVKDVREALTHEIWIKTNEKRLDKDSIIITVFVTNSKKIEDSARPFANGLYYINRDEMIRFSTKAITCLRSIHKSFVDVGDIEWRKSSIISLIDAGITPKDFINLASCKKLADL